MTTILIHTVIIIVGVSVAYAACFLFVFFFSPRLTFKMRNWEKRLHHNQISILVFIALIIVFLISMVIGMSEQIVMRSRSIGFFLGMVAGTYLHDVRLHGIENKR